MVFLYHWKVVEMSHHKLDKYSIAVPFQTALIYGKIYSFYYKLTV